jgi:hypothetical protein
MVSGKCASDRRFQAEAGEIKEADAILKSWALKIYAVQKCYSLIKCFSQDSGILKSVCQRNRITFYSCIVLEQGLIPEK